MGGGGGGGFEAYGEAMRLGPVVWGPFSVVGPSYSVVRRDRGNFFELAAIASFNCLDGSLFIQEFSTSRQGKENNTTNDDDFDDDDGLILTLVARDGKRYRFPPFVYRFAKPLAPCMEVQLKVTVLNRTRDYVSETWDKLEHSLRAQRLFEAQRQRLYFDRQLEAQVSQHGQRMCLAQVQREFEAQRQQQRQAHAQRRQFEAQRQRQAQPHQCSSLSTWTTYVSGSSTSCSTSTTTSGAGSTTSVLAHHLVNPMQNMNLGP